MGQQVEAANPRVSVPVTMLRHLGQFRLAVTFARRRLFRARSVELPAVRVDILKVVLWQRWVHLSCQSLEHSARFASYGALCA